MLKVTLIRNNNNVLWHVSGTKLPGFQIPPPPFAGYVPWAGGRGGVTLCLSFLDYRTGVMTIPPYLIVPEDPA